MYLLFNTSCIKSTWNNSLKNDNTNILILGSLQFVLQYRILDKWTWRKRKKPISNAHFCPHSTMLLQVWCSLGSQNKRIYCSIYTSSQGIETMSSNHRIGPRKSAISQTTNTCSVNVKLDNWDNLDLHRGNYIRGVLPVSIIFILTCDAINF